MKLDHIAINVKNINRAVGWYKKNLSAEVEYLDSTWALLLVGETKIALTLPNQHPPHIAFQVNSIDDIPSRNISEHRDGSKYLYKEDSEGNIIEYIFWDAVGE